MGLSLACVVQLHPRQAWKWILQAAFYGNFTKWDAHWYMRIAECGYNKISAAFFPLYPLTIHWTAHAGAISLQAAGLLISHLSLFFALYFLLRLVEEEYSEEISWRTGMLLVLFPTAYYFSSVYTEAMFLLWTTGCFFFLRERRWLLASLFGLLATLTRNTGVLLFFPVAYEITKRLREQQRLTKECLYPFLIPCGLAGFMFYLQIRMGDPLAFLHAQQHWHREFRFPWYTWWQGSREVWLSGKKGWSLYYQINEWLATQVELAGMAVSLFLPLPMRYLLYLVPAVLIPLLMPNEAKGDYFYSIPRFVLTAFPVFMAAGIILTRTRWFLLACFLSFAGQAYLLYQLTLGHFIS